MTQRHKEKLTLFESRRTLRTLWTAQHGAPAYEIVLDEERMMEQHRIKMEMNAKAARKRKKPDLKWRLESTLMKMFNRSDPVSIQQLKELADDGWSKVDKTQEGNMNNILFYNRY